MCKGKRKNKGMLNAHRHASQVITLIQQYLQYSLTNFKRYMFILKKCLLRLQTVNIFNVLKLFTLTLISLNCCVNIENIVQIGGLKDIAFIYFTT